MFHLETISTTGVDAGLGIEPDFDERAVVLAGETRDGTKRTRPKRWKMTRTNSTILL